jgi:hypothetical protein
MLSSTNKAEISIVPPTVPTCDPTTTIQSVAKVDSKQILTPTETKRRQVATVIDARAMESEIRFVEVCLKWNGSENCTWRPYNKYLLLHRFRVEKVEELIGLKLDGVFEWCGTFDDLLSMQLVSAVPETIITPIPTPDIWKSMIRTILRNTDMSPLARINLCNEALI